MVRRFSVILLLGCVVLVGCAGPRAEDDLTPSQSGGGTSLGPTPPSTPSQSSNPPFTPGTPSGPPKDPTDVVGSYWVSGTVTTGGEGPCYGFLTDAEVELALYTRADVGLTEGEHLRVRVSPASFRIDCGPGQVMRLTQVERS